MSRTKIAIWRPSGIHPNCRMRHLTFFRHFAAHLHSFSSLQPLDGQLQPVVKASPHRSLWDSNLLRQAPGCSNVIGVRENGRVAGLREVGKQL